MGLEVAVAKLNAWTDTCAGTAETTNDMMWAGRKF